NPCFHFFGAQLLTRQHQKLGLCAMSHGLCRRPKNICSEQNGNRSSTAAKSDASRPTLSNLLGPGACNSSPIRLKSVVHPLRGDTFRLRHPNATPDPQTAPSEEKLQQTRPLPP